MKLWCDYPELANKVTLYHFVREGLTVEGIAVRVGCSKKAVETALKNQRLRRPIVVRVGEEVRGRLGL